MSFDRWLKNREKPGTLEFLVRRISSKGYGYHLSVASFKIMMLAELFMGNGGNLAHLSEEIGIHRNSISRLFRIAGFDKDRLRQIAKDDK